ncbi:MAG: hypothetical protein M3395_06320 [Chloroflexota bacterium]|nr:hypothetical protein [Chloroflexota bacterium]
MALLQPHPRKTLPQRPLRLSPLGRIELAQPMPEARPALVPRAEGHLRRCTFRRLTAVDPAQRGMAVSYEVECLYAGRKAPLSLGDLPAARRICDPCGNPGIFRADED